MPSSATSAVADESGGRHEHAERLAAACLLSGVGGFLDIYTYLFRGHVFANAVTGNIVLLGYYLAQVEMGSALRYALPILFYTLGVLVAEFMHRRLPASRHISWHQRVLLLETMCLLPVAWIPFGEADFAVNALVSFVCALQVQTFRRVHGLPFASTMCTGNLRSGAEALFLHWNEGGGAEFRKSLHYGLMIFCFLLGVIAGSLLLHRCGPLIVLLAPAGLLLVFGLLKERWA